MTENQPVTKRFEDAVQNLRSQWGTKSFWKDVHRVEIVKDCVIAAYADIPTPSPANEALFASVMNEFDFRFSHVMSAALHRK